MKDFLPRILVLFFSLFTLWGQAQWYSYNSFEDKQLSYPELTDYAQRKAAEAVSKGWMTVLSPNLDCKGIVNTALAGLRSTLKGYNADLGRKLMQLKSRVDTDSLTWVNAAAGTAKDDAKTTWDNSKTALQYVQSGKDKKGLCEIIVDFQNIKAQLHLVAFFPVRNAKAAQAYFESSDTVINSDDEGVFSFESSYLNYLPSAKTLAAYTEPIGDFIGPVRLSLGLMVTAPAEKEDTVSSPKFDSKRFNEKFKSGGGNVSINFGFPLLHARLSKYFDFKSYYSPRFALDVPQTGESINKFPLHAQWLAVDNQVKIMTLENKFAFLLCHRYTRVSGNSTFYDRMGFTGDQRKSFNFTTWTVGFIAKNRLALYYTWYAGSSKVINGISNNGSITANFQLD